MLLVKTKIGPSKIHGIGLFADEDIPQGTPVWEFTLGFDLIVPETEIDKLPDNIRAYILHHCYKNKETKNYIICFDNARFINHADEPNINSCVTDKEADYASRDIKCGEEMTVDYRQFDDDYQKKYLADWPSII